MLSVRALILILAIFSASQGWAAGTIVKDGSTIQLADVTYRLDGIDAPELDQMCIDEHADAWACGVDARDQLSNLIGNRQVRCTYAAPIIHRRRDACPAFRAWRLGCPSIRPNALALGDAMVKETKFFRKQAATGLF
jgi:hypothetical protein